MERDINSLPPAVCNEVFFTGNNERSSVVATTKTYELLHETLLLTLLTFHGTIYLIVKSLFSILSLVDVYSSYDAYYTSGECVIVQKRVQSPEWVFP